MYIGYLSFVGIWNDSFVTHLSSVYETIHLLLLFRRYMKRFIQKKNDGHLVTDLSSVYETIHSKNLLWVLKSFHKIVVTPGLRLHEFWKFNQKGKSILKVKGIK